MKRLVATLALSAVALAAAACGGSSAPTAAPSVAPSVAPSGQPGVSPAAVSISAKDITFSTGELDVAANTALTISFDNPDSAPHNITILAADGSKVFGGDIIDGGKSILYAVPALAAGTYTFKCDIHPDMKGNVVVR